MRTRSLALSAGIAVAGALVLYLLQPLPALVLGATMTENPSFHPTWLSWSWIAAAAVFGLTLTMCLRVIRTQPARTLTAVIASTAMYLAVPCGVIAAASSNPVEGVNSASVLVLFAFTYYLNGWIAAITALAVVAVTARVGLRRDRQGITAQR